MCSILSWTKCKTNSRTVGDLRRHNSQVTSLHYSDVTWLSRRLKWLDHLFNDVFRVSITVPFGWNPPVTDGFPSHRVSDGESVSMWWRHHGIVTDTARCLRGRKRRRQRYGNGSGKNSWTLSSRNIISRFEDTKHSIARETKSSPVWKKWPMDLDSFDTDPTQFDSTQKVHQESSHL